MSDRPIQHEGGILKRAWSKFKAPHITVQHNPSPDSTPHKEAVSPNVRKLSQILYRSFEFSQSSKQLQKDMFRYIHAKFPELSMTEQEVAQIKQKVHDDMMERFFLGKSPGTGQVNDSNHYKGITPSEVRGEIEEAVSAMEAIFNGSYDREMIDAEAVLTDITEGIVKSDMKYLLRPEGRPGRRYDGEHERTNPYMSYLHEFAGVTGGKQNRISIPEFASMFEDIREKFLANTSSGLWKVDAVNNVITSPDNVTESDDTSRTLSTLVSRWQEKHPGQLFMDAFAKGSV